MPVINEVFEVKCRKQPTGKYGCTVFTSPDVGGVRTVKNVDDVDQIGSFDNHSTIVNPNCSVGIKAHHKKLLTCRITDHEGKRRMMCKGEIIHPIIAGKL